GTEPGDFAANWRLMAGAPADASLLADLEFAWRACRAVKSNAILLAVEQASVGIGVGQGTPVDSGRVAGAGGGGRARWSACGWEVAREGDRGVGWAAASAALFPFADGPEILTKAGVRATAEPGGSVRDDEVIAAAEAAGVALYFTGVRHFYH